ncbi:cysteine peptidase family C39 domain-containing protein [Nonomuraea sp. NPDC001699]
MRVPVVLQHSMVECGAACLAMVLGAYGHRVSLPALAAEMGVGRDGVSALALVRVARAHGLDTHALSVPAAQVPELPFPAIVHWRARPDSSAGASGIGGPGGHAMSGSASWTTGLSWPLWYSSVFSRRRPAVAAQWSRPLPGRSREEPDDAEHATTTRRPAGRGTLTALSDHRWLGTGCDRSRPSRCPRDDQPALSRLSAGV